MASKSSRTSQGIFKSFRKSPASGSNTRPSRAGRRLTAPRLGTTWQCAVERGIATVILAPRTLLREGLTSLLHDSNFRVVASIATPDELSQLLTGKVELVVLCLSAGSREDLDYLEKIVPTTRDYKIVVVAETSGLAGQPCISEILRSGADAYIFNIHSRDVLLKSLDLAVLEQKLVVLDENDVPLKFSEVPAGPTQSNGAPSQGGGNGAARFSARELEILGCLSSGDSNKIIGRTCHIAESTVKIHLKSILRKIHVQNRTQAAIWAIQNGLYATSDSSEILAASNLLHSAPDLFVAEDQI